MIVTISNIYEQKCFFRWCKNSQITQLFSWPALVDTKFSRRVLWILCSLLSVREYFEFTSFIKSITFNGIRIGHQTGKYLAVLRIYSFNFTIYLKLRSFEIILLLLNDTKQYVCQRPSVIRSDDSFEHRISWSKSGIIFLLVLLYRCLVLLHTSLGCVAVTLP